jgi:Tfp pilus assembly protein PilV
MHTFLEKTRIGRGFARRWATATRSADVRGEEGFLLIEVLISALLVAVIAIGTFNAFDVSGQITADQRAHLQATTLAQQDEERLKGLTASELASLNETRQVTLQGRKYTIASEAQFISDTSGGSTCTGSSASADYFETNSEVSWSALGSRPKVVETGLVAPPAGGEILVNVEDGRGGKTAGMTVAGTGPQALSGTTSSSGCLIFGPLEEGTYTITTSQAGYVGPNGETEPPTSERTVSATGQTTVSKAFEFNKAGEITAKFTTSLTGKPAGQATNVVIKDPELKTVNNMRTLLATDVLSNGEISSPKTIFPFSSKYAIYAGSCTSNSPENFGAGEPTGIQVEPGAEPETTLTLPSLVVLAYPGSTTGTKGTPIAKPEIWIKDVDTGSECETKGFAPKTVTSPNTTTGDLESPGLPYGKYSVCVNFVESSKKKFATTEVASSTGIENKLLAGTKVELLEGSSSPQVKSGTCPT